MRWCASSTLVALGFASFACHPDRPAEDPTKDAVHLERVGHNEAFGRGVEPERPEQKPVTSYLDEAEHIERLIHRFWVHQPDPPPAFRPLDASAAPASREAYAKRLVDTLCALGDPHLRLTPEATVTVVSGLRFAWVGEELTLVEVDERYEHPGESPKRGDVVVLMDGKPVTDWTTMGCPPTATAAAASHELGARLHEQTRGEGESVRPRELSLRNARAKTYALPITWQAASTTSRACVTGTKHSATLGQLTVHDFDCRAIDGRPDPASFATQVDLALAELDELPELVLDLRDTRGQALAGARHLAQTFGESGGVWLRQRARDPETGLQAFTDVTLPPSEVPPYSARLWVAIGPGCSGPCELAAAYLSTLPNTTTVGQTTSGAVGNTKTFKLPFSTLSLEIPVETFALPGTDTALQGRGVTPSVEVVASAGTIAEGQDPVLVAIQDRIARK